MPSASELQRLEEERLSLIQKLKRRTASKTQKEAYLRELRDIERQLGVSGMPYNSVAFGGDDGENER